MKTGLLIITILGILFIFGYKTNAQWVQTSGPYGGTVSCFAFSGSNIFAVTNGGVYLSTNNGTSWNQVNSGLTNTNHRALIIETKGKVFAEDKIFQKKKNFVETEFLKQNNDKFGYKRFDFLYLEDDIMFYKNLSKIDDKISEFFS